MIEAEYNIKIICSYCDKNFTVEECDDNGEFFCNDCEQSCFDSRFVEAFKKFPQHYSYLWNKNDKDVIDLNEEQENIYKDGIQYGFSTALFWMAEEFGVRELYEDKENELQKPLIMVKK
jgi:hypothetical protein